MINLTTYSEFHAYVVQNRNSAQLYYFIKITDVDGGTHYYSDYDTHLGDYIPRNLHSVSNVVYRASLRSGAYSISPVRVQLTNTLQHKADLDTERFSDKITSGEFETGTCEIRVGFKGITDVADLLPFYVGRINNVQYEHMYITFDVNNQSVTELPEIPKNTYTRANYGDISESLIGSPIPLVYGRWHYENTAAKYGERAYVPAVLIRDNSTAATPQLVFKVSDNELDRLYQVYLLNESLGAIGKIKDVVTVDLPNSTATINLNTWNDGAFLTVDFYLYPERYDANTFAYAQNSALGLDGDFTTYALLGNTALPLSNHETYFLKPASPLDIDFITGNVADTTGKTATGIESVKIEISGYAAATVDPGTNLVVSVVNSNWSMTFDRTALNAISDSNSFNMTKSNASSSDGDLVIRYAHKWNGTDGAFVIDENGNPDADVVPDLGHYQTMSDFAAHLEERLSAMSDAGDVDNTYSVRYLPNLNKIQVTLLTGPNSFRCKPATSGRSPDIGFITSVPSYESEVFTGAGYTILDVPDGDFSNLGIKVDYTRANVDEPKFRLKGVRCVASLFYTNFSPVTLSRESSRTGTGATGRTIPWGRNSARRTVVTGNSRARRNEQGNSNYWQRRDQLKAIAAGNFFVLADGEPAGSTYMKTAAEIIESLLSDHIGVAASKMNATSFTAAESAMSGKNAALYLPDKIGATDLFFDMLKFYGAFFWENKEGKYSISAVKSSYTDSDVNFTLKYEDMPAPLSNHFKISRSPISDMNKDLTLFYMPDNAGNSFNSQINKTSNSSLQIQPSDASCPYITDDASAANVATALAGDGDTYGYFGDFQTRIKFTSRNPKWLFAEVGDIVSLDSEFDSYYNAFGSSISSVFFMILENQYSREGVTILMQEVDESGGIIIPTESDTYFDTIDFI